MLIPVSGLVCLVLLKFEARVSVAARITRNELSEDLPKSEPSVAVRQRFASIAGRAERSRCPFDTELQKLSQSLSRVANCQHPRRSGRTLLDEADLSEERTELHC